MAMFRHGDSSVHYEIAGQGPPLLFLPGVTDSIDSHADWLGPFARNHKVIAADLPGSGKSGPQPRKYHATYYQDDAATFAALLEELGVSKAHLLGFSDGGEVALLMAIAAPTLARSVFTWGSGGFVDDPSRQIAGLFRDLFDHPIPETEGWRDSLIARYGAALARDITRNFADGVDAIVAAGGDVSRSRARHIRCPVCLIAGQQDMFVTADLLMALAGQIARVETHVVAGAGHGVHHDQPEWFTTTLTDWLATH